MKKEMSIAVRLKLSDLLGPLEGESARLLMYREFRDYLSLSEEEQKLVGCRVVQQQGGFMTYIDHPELDPQKEVEVGEILTEVVCGILKPMEENKTLKPDLLDLFIWFKPEIVKMQEREKKEAEPKKPQGS